MILFPPDIVLKAALDISECFMKWYRLKAEFSQFCKFHSALWSDSDFWLTKGFQIAKNSFFYLKSIRNLCMDECQFTVRIFILLTKIVRLLLLCSDDDKCCRWSHDNFFYALKWYQLFQSRDDYSANYLLGCSLIPAVSYKTLSGGKDLLKCFF